MREEGKVILHEMSDNGQQYFGTSAQLQLAVGRGRRARQDLEVATQRLAELRSSNDHLGTELQALREDLTQLRAHTNRVSVAAVSVMPSAFEDFRALAKRLDKAMFERCNAAVVRDGIHELVQKINALTVTTVVSENLAHKLRASERTEHVERMRELAKTRRRYLARLRKQTDALNEGLERKKALFEECEALEAELKLHDAELTLMRHEANRLEDRKRALTAHLTQPQAFRSETDAA